MYASESSQRTSRFKPEPANGSSKWHRRLTQSAMPTSSTLPFIKALKQLPLTNLIVSLSPFITTLNRPANPFCVALSTKISPRVVFFTPPQSTGIRGISIKSNTFMSTKTSPISFECMPAFALVTSILSLAPNADNSCANHSSSVFKTKLATSPAALFVRYCSRPKPKPNTTQSPLSLSITISRLRLKIMR